MRSLVLAVAVVVFLSRTSQGTEKANVCQENWGIWTQMSGILGLINGRLQTCVIICAGMTSDEWSGFWARIIWILAGFAEPYSSSHFAILNLG